MNKNVNKRDFDIFLSHAHNELKICWLTRQLANEFVGFNVWYDARELKRRFLLLSFRSPKSYFKGVKDIISTQNDWQCQKGMGKARI